MLSKEPALWDSIHSSSDFNLDVPIFDDFGGEVVLLYKIIREVAEFEVHVFVAGNRSVDVEIFNVDIHELCSRIGEYTVEEEIYCEDIDGGSVTVSQIVYYITTIGEIRALGVTLLCYVVDLKTSIGNILPECSWDI